MASQAKFGQARIVSRQRKANVPVSPKFLAANGLDGPASEPQVSVKEESEDEELKEIDQLRARVDEMARMHGSYDSGKTPMVKNPHEPTEEEVLRHNLTHANFKPWCPHCQAGLAQRDKHARKNGAKKKSFSKQDAQGDADVPDCESPKNGHAKFSIDYMKLNSKDDRSIPYSLIMVSHGDGGVFSYATPGKGAQGDSNRVAKRLAEDIDNCGTQNVSVQV